MTRAHKIPALALPAALSFAMLAAGCMHKQQIALAPSSIVPAASMQVQASADSNGNTVVNLKAEHLAAPASLSPPATDYVVWVASDSEPPQRKAILRPDSSLNAQVRFLTIAPSFTLLITAEQGRHPAQPSGTVVIRSQITRPQ